MERLCFPCLFLFLCIFSFSADAGSIGVNYGRIANDLPPAAKVVQLLKSQGLDKVKVYDTDPATLKALAGSGIKVVVDLPNEQLSKASKNPSFCNNWVQKNIVAYYPATQIYAIAVGNEVFADPANTTNYLVPAMRNIYAALVKFKLDSSIKVSSPVALSALQNSYPPSAGSFKQELIEPVIKPMLQFLSQTGSYLMANAYPFFAYIDNSDVISLDYALFRNNTGQVDSGSGLRYYSLFDAQIDAVFAAMSALKFDSVGLMVTETGWPSKGDSNEIGASPENAAAYNGNLVKRILTGGGTPLRPKAEIEVFLFALFNENQKPGATSERNYGLFYPNEQKVYNIPLTMQAVTQKGSVSGGGNNQAPTTAPAPTAAPSPAKGSGGAAPGSGGTSVSTNLAGQTWCIANNQVGNEKLQAALNYACGEGGADCSQIQPNGFCYDPNTLEAHASFAFNSYYQKNGRRTGTCDFQGAAFVVSQPPKYGKCDFTATATGN